MSSARSPSFTLIGDTVRSHRRGIVVWILGGTAAMYAIAAGFASEVARYEGGARAMAASIETGADALRLLRWPAERLDTVGGYLTYHNITLFVLFLALYAGAQGVGAVRGAEAKHTVDAIVATGHSRTAIIRDRTIGFFITLTLISIGFGAGLTLSMAAGGDPDASGSFLTAFACGGSALVAFGLGLLVSQIAGTARGANGITAVILTVLYLLTNVSDQVGPLGVVRFVSPFHYFNQSRALVPDRHFSIAAFAIVTAMAGALVVGAGWALQRRDLGAALWVRPPRASAKPTRVQRPALQRLWTATLARERLGLITWASAAGASLALMAWLEPSVIEMWDELGMTRNMFGADPDVSVSRQYLGFASEIITPIIAAFVVTQAAGWVADLEQGRVEIILSTPVSWTGLVRQRLFALVAGVAAIVAGGLTGLTIGAIAVGAELDPAGIARLAADTLLLAAAFGALAALVVASLRSGTAVTALAVFAGASYLLVLLVPLFAWPDWIARISLFGAFGHPYLEIPAYGGLAVLTGLAAIGGIAATVIAERSPKTAS